MDPRLAELYGTNQPDQADLEKLAAAEFADGLTEEGSIDLDDIDPEQLEAMAQEVLGGEETEEESDEDMEKLSEADYLGRVMAHAYVNELRGIEKVAGPIGNKMKRKDLKSAVEGNLDDAQRKALFGGKQRAKNWARTAEHYGRKVTGRIGKAYEKVRDSGTMADIKRGGKAVGGHIKRHQGKYAIGAGVAGVGTAAAYGAKKWKEKRSSAFETLAEQRAQEILENSQVEETSGYDVLQAAVEQRAAEILAENGYSVE